MKTVIALLPVRFKVALINSIAHAVRVKLPRQYCDRTKLLSIYFRIYFFFFLCIFLFFFFCFFQTTSITQHGDRREKLAFWKNGASQISRNYLSDRNMSALYMKLNANRGFDIARGIFNYEFWFFSNGHVYSAGCLHGWHITSCANPNCNCRISYRYYILIGFVTASKLEMKITVNFQN